MAVLSVDSIHFRELVENTKHNRRCLGCGMFVGQRVKYKNLGIYIKEDLGMWFCTVDCAKDWNRMEAEKSFFFERRPRIRPKDGKKQRRCPICSKHKKKVQRKQPLRTHVTFGHWACSEECKKEFSRRVVGMDALKNLP